MNALTKLKNSRCPSVFKIALYRILVPVARICVELGISAQHVTGIAKKAFVDACRQRLEADGFRASASRVALLAGLSRHETAALLVAGPESLKARETAISQILAKWITDSPWCESGRPLALEKRGPGSFEALCRSCKVSAYTAKALLEHMVEEQNIEVGADGRVRFLTLVYRSPDLTDRALSGMQNIARHASTVEHNLTGEGLMFFEQIVGSYRLSPGKREIAIKMYRQKLRRVADEITQALGVLETKERAQFDDLGVGFFIYEERSK